MDPKGEQELLDLARKRLSLRFPHLPAELVAYAVGQAAAGMGTATIRDYVPVLVEKEARDWLQAQVLLRSRRPDGSVAPAAG